MKPETFNRLHVLRMENDAVGFQMEEMRPRFERLANRHENGTAPRAVSAYQLFQTPPAIAEQLVRLANPGTGARVLEPSAGLGRIMDALNPFAPSEVVAVEIAPACASELYQQNRNGVVIKQRDFLTVTTAEIGLFDLVVMNPPFHMRSDIEHIQHALSFLKPGGTLAAICMNTSHRQEAFKPLGKWIELPSGSFKAEGTNVDAAIVIITKQP